MFHFIPGHQQEIDNLKTELETCQQQLHSKYGAVEILRNLSRLEQAKQKQLSRKALEASKRLEQVLLFIVLDRPVETTGHNTLVVLLEHCIFGKILLAYQFLISTIVMCVFSCLYYCIQL